MIAKRIVRLDARIPPETAVQIEQLASMWGKERPGLCSRADVVIEAVQRFWESEINTEEVEDGAKTNPNV